MAIIADSDLAVLAVDSYRGQTAAFHGWQQVPGSDTATDSKWLTVLDPTGRVACCSAAGTNSRIDWQRHACVWPRSVDGFPGRMQARWFEAAAVVAADLMSQAQDAKTIYLGGHSLGGALVDDMIRLLRAFAFTGEIVAITVGAPPSGNREHCLSVRRCANEYRRYVYGLDKVTRIYTMRALGYRYPVGPIRLGWDWWPFNDHDAAFYAQQIRQREVEKGT